MNRQAHQASTSRESIQSTTGTRDAIGTVSSRWLAWKAWFFRATAVTFLVGGAVASYLLFSTV